MSREQKRVLRYGTFFAIATAVFMSWLLFPSHGFAQNTTPTMTIGTGGPTGVYYPIGQALCRAMKKKQGPQGVRCSAINTGGSVENVDKLRAGAIDFGVVQSDVQYFAVKGFGPFRGKGPDAKIRSVLSFYPEAFTIVARADAGIRTINHLKGKRVNIGNPGSGQRTSMDLVMHLKGWKKKDFALTMELPSDKQSEALCANKIDAMIFTVGHPNTSIKDAADSCATVLVSAAGPAIKKLLQKFPYFSAVRIPSGTYAGTPLSTVTFGVRATLVASVDTPDDVVYTMLQAIFDDLIDIKFSHPALLVMNPDDMTSKGFSAPLHPGALRFYRKSGGVPNVQEVAPPRHR